MVTLDVVFWGCLGFGVVYAVVTLLFGEITGDFFAGMEIPILQPITLVAAIAGFGGCGVFLSHVTSMSSAALLVASAVFGIVLAVLAYFLWVKPMSKAESSTTFSIKDLEGSIGEVFTTIPAEGFGEVVITRSSGRSNYIAASLEKVRIPRGTRIVVVKVENKILYVSVLSL